jgi:hypothetical protein
MFGTIKNIIKKIGFTASALALAAGIASAPSASASSLSASSSPVPIVEEQVGKLQVYVAFQSPTTTQQATVTVYDQGGQSVAKALAGNNSPAGFVLNEGIYKVYVTAKGYETAAQVVEVTANSSTAVKFGLKRALASPR